MHITSRVTGTFLVLVCLTILTAFPLSGCRRTPTGTHLDLDPGQQEYSFLKIREMQISPSSDRRMSLVAADIDGDGIREFVEGTAGKLLGHDQEDAGGIKVRWEVHLPDGYRVPEKNFQFGQPFDADGDLVEEIYFPVVAEDLSGWRFTALDPATGGFFLDVSLPVGENRRRPDHWDGWYRTVGVLPDADGRGQPGIVMSRQVGYDATLRGICVVSPATGDIIWEYVSGAQPAGDGVVVTDLEGDGRREVCMVTSAPDNLDGRLINGTSDDRTYLIVLDHKGREILREQLGGSFSIGELVTADLDADGVQELIYTVLDRRAGGNNQLTIYSWRERRPLVAVRRASSIRGVAVLPGPAADTWWLYTGSDNGSVMRYLYGDGRLAMDRQVVQDEPQVKVIGTGDFLPESGSEVFLSIPTTGTLAVLDRDLRTLGSYAGQKGVDMGGVLFWQRQPGKVALVTGHERGHWVLEASRNSTPILAVAARAALLVLLVAAGALLFLWGRRTGRRETAGQPGPAPVQVSADRQALYLLYRELADMNHQVLGQAKGLARLIWLLDAYSSEVGPNAELEQRIEQVLLDYRESVRPILESILRQAAAVGFEAQVVRATTADLTVLSARLDELSEAGLDPGRVAAARADLSAEWNAVRKGFRHLHETINDYFTTDPVRMIKGMLLVRTEEFERAGIKAEFIAGDRPARGALAKIDSGDLRLVLDNLLDNALRAMQDTDGGRLMIQLTGHEQEISCHVTDNGQGIDPGLHQEIFSSRYSSRRGGGRGLYRSREIMERWGGEIILADSRPGKGTTFIVKLLAAADGPVRRTREASA